MTTSRDDRRGPPTRTDVIVIGAGIAGLSAGVRLAEAGLAVLVAEEAPRLGGRATSFVDRDSGERVDNGQHVMFGCYHDTYALLATIGTAHAAPLAARLDVTMASTDGRAHTLTCPAWPPPWHLLGGVLRWTAVSLRDRLSVVRLAGVLRAVRRRGAAAVARDAPADQTVSAWLRAHGQSERLCEWLWRPLAIAALNQSPDVAAAAPFVRVLGELFGPRVQDSAVGLPTVPLDELFAASSARFIESRGGAVLTKSPARIIVDAAGRVAGARIGEIDVPAAAVVSAVPWHAFDRIWQHGVPPAMSAIAANAARMTPVPIVSVNLWFDRAVMAQPVLGLIGASMHWAFDKSRIFGNRAGHITMVASGAENLAALDNGTLADLATRDLVHAIPSARGAIRRAAGVVREHRATWSLAPGAPARPSTVTPLAGFYLAGDWTDTGLPGTIEGAVRSGAAAASAVLHSREER